MHELNVLMKKQSVDTGFWGSLNKDNYTFEAKKTLTAFLEDEGRIPSKETIRNSYDRIVPDDWEKLHQTAYELVRDADENELTRLTVPVLPRIYYKSVHNGQVNRIVVEADGEKKEFRMLVFILKDCYHLLKEIRFFLPSGRELGIDMNDNWFDIFAELYGAWDKENPEFMKRTEGLRSYYDMIYDLTDQLQNLDEEAFEKDKEDVFDYAKECMNLIVYMNHCIDIEIEKRRQAEEELLKKKSEQKEAVDTDEKKKRQIVYHENSKKNAREIYIGDICINLGKKSGTKRSGIMRRKCLCWGVRGHKRYYKSGKVVYIRPYKKGRDRLTSNPDGKTYKLKG